MEKFSSCNLLLFIIFQLSLATDIFIFHPNNVFAGMGLVNYDCNMNFNKFVQSCPNITHQTWSDWTACAKYDHKYKTRPTVGPLKNQHNLMLWENCVLSVDLQIVRSRRSVLFVMDFTTKSDLHNSLDVVVRGDNPSVEAITIAAMKQLAEIININSVDSDLIMRIVQQQIEMRNNLRHSKQVAVRDMQRRSKRILIILGELASVSEQIMMYNSEDWVALPFQAVDVTDVSDFEYLFDEKTVDTFVMEHVLEHLDLAEAIVALQNCYHYLRPGGILRIAVPDVIDLPLKFSFDAQNHDPKKCEQECSFSSTAKQKIFNISTSNSLVKETKSKHQLIFSSTALVSLLTSIGFSTELLEWTDSYGIYHHKPWNSSDGNIKRSFQNGHKSRSLIIDASKPLNHDLSVSSTAQPSVVIMINYCNIVTLRLLMRVVGMLRDNITVVLRSDENCGAVACSFTLINMLCPALDVYCRCAEDLENFVNISIRGYFQEIVSFNNSQPSIIASIFSPIHCRIKESFFVGNFLSSEHGCATFFIGDELNIWWSARYMVNQVK